MPLRPSRLLVLVPAGVAAAAVVIAAPAGASPGTVATIGVSGLALAVLGDLTAAWRRRADIRRLADAVAAYEPDADAPRPTRAGPLPAVRDRDLAHLRTTVEATASRTDRVLRQLTKQSRNLEAVLAALDEPVIATDNTDRVLLCNPSAETLFADAEGEAEATTSITGRALADLFTHEALLDMHRAARRGDVRRARVELTTALGRRVFQVSSAPVPAAWGTGIFGAVLLLRDVTELDAAVQIKSDFVANASHELRTPVAAIRAASETLDQAVEDDPKMARRLATMIHAHADHLQEMIRDLLDLSRLESPHARARVRQLNLRSITGRLADTFADVCATRRLALDVQIEDECHGAYTDPDLVALILRNYIENATRFAYPDTTITVTAGLVEAVWPDGINPARRTTPAPKPLEATLRLEVTDRGLGIPLHHQQRVFERYYQVEPARSSNIDTPSGKLRRGTGLGLAIVKHAAKSLGGTVGVRSVWQQQTTFWAEVPLTFTPPDDDNDQPAAATEAHAEAPPAPGF